MPRATEWRHCRLAHEDLPDPDQQKAKEHRQVHSFRMQCEWGDIRGRCLGCKTKEEEPVDSGTILAEVDNDEEKSVVTDIPLAPEDGDEAKEEETVDSGSIVAQDNNDEETIVKIFRDI